MAKLANRIALLAAWPAVLLAQAAVALGLGDVHQKSALNQPLDASIEIIATTPAELEGLTVALADAAAFERAGIQRAGYLDRLRFDVDKAASGGPAIRITTKDAFREPFVHFLVEVNSSQGRVRREYTLLLDPPGSLPKVAAAPVAPKLPPPDAPPSRVQQTPPSAPPRAVADGRPQMPLRVASPTPQRASAPVAPAAAAVGSDTYGPIAKQETLWSIASKLGNKVGASPQQMMLALLRTNPDAFPDGNINSMKTGAVLRVPSVAEATRLSRDEAIRGVKDQNTEWQRIAGGATRPSAATPATPRAQPIAKPSPQPASPGGAAGGVAVSEDVGRLKIIGGDAVTDTEVVEELERLVKEVTLANETAESRRLENEELRDRVGRLEQGVDKMQRLIELKDDEIASLQDKVRAAAGRAEAPDEPVDEARQPTEPPAPTSVEAAPAEAAKPAVEPVSGDQPVEQAVAPKTDATPKPKPKIRVKQEPEPSFLDQLLDDPLVLIGGAVAAALALVGLLLRRRRAAKDKDDGFDARADRKGEPADSDAGKPKRKFQLPKFDLKALLARFGKKKGDAAALAAVAGGAAAVAAVAARGGERDLGEKHFAEGRFSEAAVQFARAADAEPGDFELRSRMLEAYAKAGDAIAFEREAEALYADREGREDALWQRVVGMGRQLLPAHPLFIADEQTGRDAVDQPVAQPAGGNQDIAEFDDLDLDDVDIATDFAGGESHVDLSGELDLSGEEFDLGSIAGINATAVDMDPLAELDLPDIKAPASKDMDELFFTPASGAASQPDADADADAGLDFELDIGIPDAGRPARQPTGPDDGDMVFDLSGFELGDADDAEIDLGEFDVPDNGAAELDVGFDQLGEEIDLLTDGAEPSSATPTLAGGIDDFDEIDMDAGLHEMSAGGDSEEVDTKLDLARAYVDMGDPDGARVMLEEVLSEGSDAQRRQAQALIDQM
ncbi:MAG: hypothetical protein H6980_02955 [Gammaproteobacteria bacterium]|nr:hypothetical protein [Gammaproteobacteria bacterium]